MKKTGIGCQIDFWEASTISYLNYPNCNNAKMLHTHAIVLPILSKLTDDNLGYIIDTFMNILSENSLET